MADFSYPNVINKDTPAIAAEVQSNFDAIRSWILDNCLQVDGSKAMLAPLILSGPPSQPDHAVNQAYVSGTVLVVGTIFEYGGSSVPTGFLRCDGATYSTTAQPTLYAAIGRNYTAAAIPQGSFQVPDRRGTVGVGYQAGDQFFGAIGATGGSRDAPLVTHTHTATMSGTASTNTHRAAPRSSTQLRHLHRTTRRHAGHDPADPEPAEARSDSHSHTISGTVTVPAPAGAVPGVNANMMPFTVSNFIIYAGKDWMAEGYNIA